MNLVSIWLQNFRNHQDLLIEFDPTVTVIIGPNGSGKTNLLEAIFLLATGKSFRAERVEEMVGWGSEVGRVKGIIKNSEFSASTSLSVKIQNSEELEIQNSILKTELEVILTRGLVQNQKTPLKTLMVNGVRRQLRTFAGNLRVVMFGPGDMRLIEGSPARRRDFLDNILGQIYPEYLRSLLSYEKGLRRRNKVLWAIKDGMASHNQLFFWDRLLIKEGEAISRHRKQFIEFLNFPRDHPSLKGGDPFSIEYDDSPISEARLAQYAREEVAAGVTLVGPHRDDFHVQVQSSKFKVQSYVNGQMSDVNCVDLSTYGSRGQQRMAVLRLKLGALAFIEAKTGEKPVLLLDDIFSELDHEHREVVREVLKSCQTIITAADEHLVEGIEEKVVWL